MINIDVKQADLNYLFQFDLLKQILLNLSKNQENLFQEINKINDSNAVRDERITRLENSVNLDSVIPISKEQIINSSQSDIENLITEKNEIINEDNLDKDENIGKDKENEIPNTNKEENIDRKEEKIEDNKEEEIEKNNENKNIENQNKNKEDIKEEKDKQEEKKEITNQEDNKVIKEKEGKKFEHENNINQPVHINKPENENISNNINLNSDKSIKISNLDNKKKSNDIYLAMMKGNREQKERLSILEKKLTKELELQIKKVKEDFKKHIKNLSNENKSSFDNINEKISDLSQKNIDQEEKLEDCIVKCNNFDIFNVIKDSGDGSIDLAKVLIKSLEEKVFKKFEFIDQRNKLEGMEIMKITKLSENINNKMASIERGFNDIKESEINQMKEDIENNKNNNEKKIEEINNNLNNKEINLVQKINDLEMNILKILDEKDNRFNKKYQEIKENQNNVKLRIDEEELLLNKSRSNIDTDTIETLERRIAELRSKTNNIDSTLKYIMKDWNIEILKKDIKEMQNDLSKKITKDNLKELYNLHISDLDEINELRDHASVIYEDLKKTIKNVSALAPKVESLMGNILSLKQTNKSLKIPQIDTSKFLEITKFNEGMIQISKKIENIYREIDSLRRDYYDIKDEYKLFEKKERVMRMEEDIYKKIDENNLKYQRNKNEINKISKGFEMEIKSIWNEFKRKEQADSWILAKQPMKCFNCATCDNNIRKQIVSDESVPWNRYPQNEKNYRLGKGFSHMLEMMTYEFIKNLDENNQNKENQPISDETNLSSSNNNNNEENKINEKNVSVSQNMTKIAEIRRSASTNKLINGEGKEETKNILPINSGRIRLPQVYDISKKKIKFENLKNMNSNLNQEKIENYGNEKIKRNDSPQILKISKKNNNSGQFFSPTASSKRSVINGD